MLHRNREVDDIKKLDRSHPVIVVSNAKFYATGIKGSAAANATFLSAAGG